MNFITKTENIRENQELSAQKSDAREYKTIKIIYLNDDCLEYIFNYLNLHDLLSIGESNTRFQYAAGIVFKRKFGYDVQIYLNGSGDLSCYIRCIKLDVMQCQRLIPVFGDFISSVILRYDKFSDRINKNIFEKIFDDLSKHSLESLTKIAFIDFPRGWLSKFSKPLTKVESVVLDDCDLSDKTVFLSKIFPKISHLKIWSCDNSECHQIKTHFPYLINLELMFIYEPKLPDFKSLLMLNPQLLTCVYDNFYASSSTHWKFVRFIAKKSKFEKFKLLSEFPPDERIHFRNVKHFVYSGNGNSFPFTFDRLEKLKLLCINHMEIDEIIKQNDELDELTMCIKRNISSFLSKELAKIPAITFNMRWWNDWENLKEDVDAVIEFINEKTLGLSIKMKYYRRFEQKYLEEGIDKSKWRMNFVKDGRDLQIIRRNTY